MEAAEYRRALKKFAAHRLEKDGQFVLDAWVIGMRDGNVPAHEDDTVVGVFLSHVDGLKGRKVDHFDISVRELIASLEAFKEPVPIHERGN